MQPTSPQGIAVPRGKTLYVPEKQEAEFAPRPRPPFIAKKPGKPHSFSKPSKPKGFDHDNYIASLIGRTLKFELNGGERLIGTLLSADRYTLLVEGMERYWPDDETAANLPGKVLLFKHALANISFNYAGADQDVGNG